MIGTYVNYKITKRKANHIINLIIKRSCVTFFWKNVKRVINQNKKNGLQDFLFPKETFYSTEEMDLDIQSLKKKIQHLENSQSNTPLPDTDDSTFQNLKNISDTEKQEIIQKGFELQAEGIISLRDYYEGDQKNTLLNLKGYRIKYESVRRTKLYKLFKESINN